MLLFNFSLRKSFHWKRAREFAAQRLFLILVDSLLRCFSAERRNGLRNEINYNCCLFAPAWLEFPNPILLTPSSFGATRDNGGKSSFFHSTMARLEFL